MADASETIVRVCMDEFSKAVFIYTSAHKLYGYKYGLKDGESLTVNELMYSHDMSAEHPSVESSQVIQMDYVQEL